MTDHLLPAAVPITTAAIIAGLSPATFRVRCLDSGLVRSNGDDVPFWSLAAYLGHPIELEAYLAADRRRDRARRWQRQYRREHA
jgi:hypothetical protein